MRKRGAVADAHALSGSVIKYRGSLAFHRRYGRADRSEISKWPGIGQPQESAGSYQ
jgi:hypothetical protein